MVTSFPVRHQKSTPGHRQGKIGGVKDAADFDGELSRP
jgi:hypothetical protein